MRASCVLLLVIAASIFSEVVSVPLSAWTEGSSSFFGGPQGKSSSGYKLTIDSGSCGYGDFDPRLYPNYNVIGLHKSNPLVAGRPMNACGSCLEVQCRDREEVCRSKAPIQFVITDQCVTDCNSTNVNIHVLGFEQVAGLPFGRAHIRYRLVECEPADPIIIHIMDYRATAGGWMRLALKNVAGDAALTAVEIGTGTGNASAWMPCKNTFGAVWEAGFNGIALPSPPLNLRVTNKLKQQVIVNDFVAFAGMVGDIETTVQFPSPYEGSEAPAPLSTNTITAGEEAVFTPPIPMGLPSVTIGMAIPKPTNTLTGPLPALMANKSRAAESTPTPQIVPLAAPVTAPPARGPAGPTSPPVRATSIPQGPAAFTSTAPVKPATTPKRPTAAAGRVGGVVVRPSVATERAVGPQAAGVRQQAPPQAPPAAGAGKVHARKFLHFF